MDSSVVFVVFSPGVVVFFQPFFRDARQLHAQRSLALDRGITRYYNRGALGNLRHVFICQSSRDVVRIVRVAKQQQHCEQGILLRVPRRFTS